MIQTLDINAPYVSMPNPASREHSVLFPNFTVTLVPLDGYWGNPLTGEMEV